MIVEDLYTFLKSFEDSVDDPVPEVDPEPDVVPDPEVDPEPDVVPDPAKGKTMLSFGSIAGVKFVEGLTTLINLLPEKLHLISTIGIEPEEDKLMLKLVRNDGPNDS
jgi:hypothetical protein